MDLKEYIRSIPDYPKKGILFRDITTLIKNEKAFSKCIDEIVELSKKFEFVFGKFNTSFGPSSRSNLSISKNIPPFEQVLIKINKD